MCKLHTPPPHNIYGLFCYLLLLFPQFTKVLANAAMMQIDVDIGSSSVARSIIGLVLGYVTSIVVDLAILIEVCAFLLSVLCERSPVLLVWTCALLYGLEIVDGFWALFDPSSGGFCLLLSLFCGSTILLVWACVLLAVCTWAFDSLNRHFNCVRVLLFVQVLLSHFVAFSYSSF